MIYLSSMFISGSKLCGIQFWKPNSYWPFKPFPGLLETTVPVYWTFFFGCISHDLLQQFLLLLSLNSSLPHGHLHFTFKSLSTLQFVAARRVSNVHFATDNPRNWLIDFNLQSAANHWRILNNSAIYNYQ